MRENEWNRVARGRLTERRALLGIPPSHEGGYHPLALPVAALAESVGETRPQLPSLHARAPPSHEGGYYPSRSPWPRSPRAWARPVRNGLRFTFLRRRLLPLALPVAALAKSVGDTRPQRPSLHTRAPPSHEGGYFSRFTASRTAAAISVALIPFRHFRSCGQGVVNQHGAHSGGS